MNVLDLLIGKKVKVMTDAKVEVELEIKRVSENRHTTSRDLEPATPANDWWPASESTTTINYVVEFTNGYNKQYNSLKSIKILK